MGVDEVLLGVVVVDELAGVLALGLAGAVVLFWLGKPRLISTTRAVALPVWREFLRSAFCSLQV